MGGAIAGRSYNRFAFSLMLLRPPLFLLLAVAMLAVLLNAWAMQPMILLWIAAWAGFMMISLKSLHHFQADVRIYQALWRAPIFIFHQVVALFRAKQANELSVATKHEQRSVISDVKAKW